ncbi:MAG TPA: autotransporter domain-containing protein [Pseudolabrys sp.]|nr:autotransporter domain-containing protein [Pseudolabrys sp.]
MQFSYAAPAAALFLICISGFATEVVTPAFAACTPAASGGNPPPGTTVVCSGTTLNQNVGNGYGTGAQTGLTVQVDSGASVTGTTYGLYLQAPTIFNSGTINSTAGVAIRSDSTTTVTNNAGAFITGAVGIQSFGDVTLTNAGTLNATTNYGISSQTGSATVTNLAGSVINSSNTAIAGNGVVVVSNAGSITATGNALAYGVVGSNVTITNTAGALIRGRFGGVNGNVINVTNGGTIEAIVGFGIVGAQAGSSVTVNNLAGGIITAPVYSVGSTTGVVTVTNAGTITATDPAGLAIVSGATKVDVTNYAGGVISANTGIQSSAGASTVFNAGTITGNGGTAIDFSLGANNILTIAPGSVINGNVLGSGTDKLQFGGTGTGSFDVSQIGPAAQYSGFNALGKIGDSDMTLTGTSATAFPVTVQQGRLAVDGSLANSAFTVTGGTLGGIGTLGATTIASGGTFAPGNSIGTIAVNGNLTFNSGSTYAVEVSQTTADRTNVTGSAALAGRLLVLPTTRLNATTTYTIMNAASYSGAFDTTVISSPAFARFRSVTVVGSDLLLSLDPGSLVAALIGASRNQQNVAQGIDNGLSSGGALPQGFATLLNLSGALLNSALDQVSGEAGAGSTQASFDVSNQFMNLLFDPATHGGTGEGGVSSFTPEPLGYAAKNKRDAKAADAYASMTPRDRREAFAARWSVWAAGYAGASKTSGDTGAGSHSTNNRIYGTAVGADYRLSPDTLIGVALGGAGFNYGLDQGLGGGRADLFQAGLFGRKDFGPAYLSAALAYAWQDVRADRTVGISGTDRLRAGFNTNTFAARVETGYRYAATFAAVTPYAAVQSTSFMLPGYSETATSGSNQFALTYASKTTTDVRTELGARTDKSFLVHDGIFTLRGRAAWAHDSNTDRPVTAAFQALPGSSFTVNGAQSAANAVLVGAGAEMTWGNGISLAALFDGEFSRTTTSYAGKGAVKYAW